MGQTQGGNSGNLELLKKIEEQKKTTLDIKTILIGFGEVNFFGFAFKKTMKLTVENEGKRHGAVLLCTQSHSCSITWELENTATFSIQGSISPNTTINGNVMTIEMVNNGQCGFVIIGGVISGAKIEVY